MGILAVVKVSPILAVRIGVFALAGYVQNAGGGSLATQAVKFRGMQYVMRCLNAH